MTRPPMPPHVLTDEEYKRHPLISRTTDAYHKGIATFGVELPTWRRVGWHPSVGSRRRSRERDKPTRPSGPRIRQDAYREAAD